MRGEDGSVRSIVGTFFFLGVISFFFCFCCWLCLVVFFGSPSLCPVVPLSRLAPSLLPRVPLARVPLSRLAPSLPPRVPLSRCPVVPLSRLAPFGSVPSARCPVWLRPFLPVSRWPVSRCPVWLRLSFPLSLWLMDPVSRCPVVPLSRGRLRAPSRLSRNPARKKRLKTIGFSAGVASQRVDHFDLF